MIKILHIVALELFTALLATRTTMMWLNKKHLLARYGRAISLLLTFLFITGITAGIIMYNEYYNFYTPFWLQLKFVLLALSFTVGQIGNLKSNKYLMLLSVVINLLIILIANLKPL